jgi:hypothetical protein
MKKQILTVMLMSTISLISYAVDNGLTENIAITSSNITCKVGVIYASASSSLSGTIQELEVKDGMAKTKVNSPSGQKGELLIYVGTDVQHIKLTVDLDVDKKKEQYIPMALVKSKKATSTNIHLPIFNGETTVGGRLDITKSALERLNKYGITKDTELNTPRFMRLVAKAIQNRDLVYGEIIATAVYSCSK